MRAGEPFRPWAVIPAKRFGRAKSRLMHDLGVSERQALARSMFERVLSACQSSHELEGTLVATDGEDAARIALLRGAAVLRDQTTTTRAKLSDVIDTALASLATRGATHALVLMADLPLFSVRDVAEILAPMRNHDLVVVPDQQRRGTSALGLRLGLGLRTWFGHDDSLQRHLREAERTECQRHVLHNPRVAFDLDSPADFRKFTRVSVPDRPW